MKVVSNCTAKSDSFKKSLKDRKLHSPESESCNSISQ